MRFSKPILATAISLVAVAAIAFTFETYNLKRAPKEGSAATYTIKANMQVMGQDVDFSADLAEKIKMVAPNGEYSVEASQTNIKVAGQDVPAPETVSVTTYKPNGELIKKEGGDTSPEGYRMSQLEGFIAPDSEINVGDSWTKELAANKERGTVATKATYKLEAVEKVGDVDTLKISYTIKETEGDKPASTEGTTWIRKDDRSMVKEEATWTDMPIPGAPAPVSGKISVARKS